MKKEEYDKIIERYEFTEDGLIDAYFEVKDFCRDLNEILEQCSGQLLDMDQGQNLVKIYDKFDEIQKFLKNKLNIES